MEEGNWIMVGMLEVLGVKKEFWYRVLRSHSRGTSGTEAPLQTIKFVHNRELVYYSQRIILFCHQYS